MKLWPELVMALVIEFGAAARAEFDEAFHWYAERSGDAALSFAAEVELAIGKLAADPGRFPPTYAGCQQCLLHRFPYSIVFHRSAGKISIVAIAHAKRRPGYWTHRR